MMNARAALPLALLLALAACSRPADKAVPPTKVDKPPSEWAFGMGKNSVELVHMLGGDTRDPDLRMICARGQGFAVLLPRATPIGSEERLTIGAGGEAHALVASAGGGGVQAIGPIEEPLLKILGGSAPISASYGAQTIGPFDPPPALRRALVETCRKLLTGGQV